MAKMSQYSKVYPSSRFEVFPEWTANARVGEANDANALDANALNGYLFLHDSFVVTRGVFVDEDVVYDLVSPEWIDFCKTELHFSSEEALGHADTGGEAARATQPA